VQSIQWYPDGSIWTASNTGPLQSFGLIMQGEVIRRLGDHMFRADMNVQFLRADRLNNDDNLQEIYVPMWTGQMNIFWQYRTWGCLLKNQYRSERYYLNSASSVLPAVNLTDFHISYSSSICNTGVRMQIGVNNIFNVEHEWIIHRPMPGRTLEGTLSITL
jgi:outer membrane receptor protein involved in Fe transport